MKKAILILAILLVAVTGVYYLMSYLAIQSQFERDNIPNDLKFENQAWAKGTIRQRGQMVNYLVDSIGVVNKTRAEIETLLGKPDEENNVEDAEYKSMFHYTVDKGHPFTYDMILFFDSTGRVTDVLLDD